MHRYLSLLAVVVLVLAGLVSAADPPPLMTAQGQVEKADKETLTVKPRGPDGKFLPTLVLKVTGTSKVSVLAPRKGAGGKMVMTQKEASAKDLEPKQAVAVIYTTVDGNTVLLTAVAQPPAAK
jgi:hypothetical protein